MPYRVDSSEVTCRVQRGDGTWITVGVMEDRTGGASDSSTTVYPKGGVGKPRLALGGRPEPAPVMVRRLYDDVAQSQEGELRALAGKGAMVVNEQPVNDAEEAAGRSTTWTGRLKSVTITDSTQEGNAGKQLELEMLVETVV